MRKQFGGLVAVNDVASQIDAGEIVGLIGPNGAGKSTTFNLITGVLPATRGRCFAGAARRCSGLPSRDRGAGVSRTFQHVKMIPEMTVLENVALGGYLQRQRRRAAACCAWTAAEERACSPRPKRQLQRIGMADRMHELAGNLALGPQRLMEIARALCRPALLLLDEPAAGLRHQEKQALPRAAPAAKAEGMASCWSSTTWTS